MSDFFGLTIKDWIIVAVVFILILCVFKIRNLKKSLRQEIRNRLAPLLRPEINRTDAGLYLKNEGFAYAKDIVIDDIAITLDYEFKKTIRLKFGEVKLLRPDQQVKLHCTVVGEGHDTTSRIEDYLINQLHASSFEMIIYYKNIENTKFSSTIVKDKNGFSIRETMPCPQE